MHLGNIANFLLTWLMVQCSQGTLLLRIDDIDAERTKPPFIQDIFSSLAWLNIQVDHGPSSPDDFTKNWSQHNRLDIYNSWLAKLVSSRKLFACTCSRTDLLQRTNSGIYDGFCKHKNLPFTTPNCNWRMLINPLEAYTIDYTNQASKTLTAEAVCGNPAVRKKDGNPAYQLACIADDVHYKINYAIRGLDLVESSLAQQAIAAAAKLFKHQKITYLHHPLIVHQNGLKLSKSAGDTSIQYARSQGATPKQILQQAAQFLGIPVHGQEQKPHDFLESFMPMYLNIMQTKNAL